MLKRRNEVRISTIQQVNLCHTSLSSTTDFIFFRVFHCLCPSVKHYISLDTWMGFFFFFRFPIFGEFACLRGDAKVLFWHTSKFTLSDRFYFLFMLSRSNSEREALCQLKHSNGFSHFERFPKYKWVCLLKRQCRDYFRHVSKFTPATNYLLFLP